MTRCNLTQAFASPTPLYRHSAPRVPSRATTSSSKAFQILQSPSGEQLTMIWMWFCKTALGGVHDDNAAILLILWPPLSGHDVKQTAGDTMQSCYPLSGGHLGPCSQASPSGLVFKTDRPSNELSCLTIYCSSKPAICISSDALLKEQLNLKLTIHHHLLTLMSFHIFLILANHFNIN